MALLYPDILQHNNSSRALIDITELRGNSYPIGVLSETGSIPIDKRKIGQIVFVSSSQSFYGFYGQTTSSLNWNNSLNWKPLSSNTGSFTGSFTGSLKGTAATASYLNLLNQDLQINGGLVIGNNFLIDRTPVSGSGYNWETISGSYLDINNVGLYFSNPGISITPIDRSDVGLTLNSLSVIYDLGYNIGDILELSLIQVNLAIGGTSIYDIYLNTDYYSNNIYTITNITEVDGVFIYEFDHSFNDVYYNIIGTKNVNILPNSLLVGSSNYNNDTGSTVLGLMNSSSAEYQTVVGTSNKSISNKYAFIVGSGLPNNYNPFKRNSVEIYLTSSLAYPSLMTVPYLNIYSNTYFDLFNPLFSLSNAYNDHFIYNINYSGSTRLHVSSSGIGINKTNPNSELDISGSLTVSGSVIIAPSGSIVIPTTSSHINLRKTGSMYWDEPYLYIWNGNRFMSASFY